MAQIKTDSRHYQNIADKIREKTGGSDTYYPQEMPGGIDEVYEAGQKAENERYWQKFWAGLKNPNGDNYSLREAFAGGGWNEETFSKIIYPSERIIIQGSTAAINTFSYFNRNYKYDNPLIDLTEFCQRVDFSGCTIFDSTFKNARAKNITIDCSSATTISYIFDCDNGGEFENLTIKVSRNCTSYARAFFYQYSIKEIRFTEDSEIVAGISFVHSDKLSAESIQSIINALGIVTNSPKITFHSTVLGKLTAEQITQIGDKGWVLG